MTDTQNKASRVPWVGRFALGTLAGVVASLLPLLFTPRGDPRLFLLWALVLLLTSCGLAILNPHRPWAWGLSVGLALPVVVVARIVVDTIRLAEGAVWPETEEHTLFPLEIALAFVIGLSAAFLGAYVGCLVGRRIA